MDIAAKASDLLEFSSAKRVPLILQAEMAECGLASMAMVASYFGHQLDLPAMRKRFSANLNGMTLQQLIEVGESLSLASRALKCDMKDITNLKLPCILHWDMNHFVVLTKCTSNEFHINDPAKGKRTFNREELGKHFTGIALELFPTSSFEIKKEHQKMRIMQLWSKLYGLKTVLLKLFCLSLIMQIFALLTPYYMKWVVDEVLITYDDALLVILAFGFTLITIMGVITSAVRSWLILRLSSVLNMQLGINLLRHLLHLPMSFFESRHIGDVVSRFGSLNQIRERLTSGIIETLVDGIMSIILLIVMSMYSFKLTIIVLATVALYTLTRILLYQPLHQATEESIQNSANEQSNFLENIRGIQTIKLFGNESQRQSIWQNRFAEVINADIHLGKLQISFDSINKVLFGIENILVIFFAANFVINQVLTIGIVLAFIAYKNQFTHSIANLIEQFIQFKMIRLHLDRISDIALANEEQHREPLTLHFINGSGEITLENITFRYKDTDKNIIENVTVNIKDGDCIAITGKSGAGKSTLMKLMLGLLQPTSGRILYNGQDITHIGMKQYRKSIAAVMQDDTLLAGSIADNICFFDPEPNYLQIKECAQLAEIDNDICKMTMGYDALVGDMGSCLSGGQQQRLLLARALYKKPDILFMDEATSHLDTTNESSICQKIAQLPMTRIIIAHRPETIAHANKVYNLDCGHLTQVTSQIRCAENSKA